MVHANGDKQCQTAILFATLHPHLKISQPLISFWIETRACNSWKIYNSRKKLGRKKDVAFPEVDQLLVKYIQNENQNSLLLSGEEIMGQWIEFSQLQGIPRSLWLSLGGGWLDCSKKKSDLRKYKTQIEAASASQGKVETQGEHVRAITAGYKPPDIYNMDNIFLFYA